MQEIEYITGAEKLVAVYGYWPSFHDAGVLWMRLDRGSSDSGYGPTLEAMVHTFEMTSETNADGYYVLRHHVLANLRLRRVVELRLDGFNYQNALMEIKLVDLRDLQMERVLWDVEIASAHGVAASFRCQDIEVVSVVPCTKNGEPVPT